MQLYEDTRKLLSDFEMRFWSTQRGLTLAAGSLLIAQFMGIVCVALCVCGQVVVGTYSSLALLSPHGSSKLEVTDAGAVSSVVYLMVNNYCAGVNFETMAL